MSATELTALAPVTDGPWAPITAAAPKMAATMRAYLDQIAVSLRPRSVEAADNALRSVEPSAAARAEELTDKAKQGPA